MYFPGLTFGLAMMAILLSNGLLIPVVAATGLAGQVLGTHLTLNRTKERIERTVSNCESDQVQKTEGLESAESDLFWAEIEKQATLSNLDTASLQVKQHITCLKINTGSMVASWR